MKVAEAIAQLNELRPNQYGDGVIARWLSTLDALIYSEYAGGREGWEGRPHGPYDGAGMGEELLVPEPYSDIYVKYLAAQVDYHNAELDRYNNSMMLYNAALGAFADFLSRTAAPVTRATIEV